MNSNFHYKLTSKEAHFKCFLNSFHISLYEIKNHVTFYNLKMFKTLKKIDVCSIIYSIIIETGNLDVCIHS